MGAIPCQIDSGLKSEVEVARVQQHLCWVTAKTGVKVERSQNRPESRALSQCWSLVLKAKFVELRLVHVVVEEVIDIPPWAAALALTARGPHAAPQFDKVASDALRQRPYKCDWHRYTSTM